MLLYRANVTSYNTTNLVTLMELDCSKCKIYTTHASYMHTYICFSMNIRIVKGVLKWIEMGKKELIAESIFMQFVNVSQFQYYTVLALGEFTCIHQKLSSSEVYEVIKTHGSVSCGPRNLGHTTDKYVFYRSKENAVFIHLLFDTP